MSFNHNYNDAETVKEYTLIPENTLAKAVLSIKPGGYREDMLVTESKNTGSLYLNVYFHIISGPYSKRVIYNMIGIKGTKLNAEGQDTFGKMGRAMTRAILESARNIDPKDKSENAAKKREMKSFEDLNGLEVGIKIGIDNSNFNDSGPKNKIISIITPSHVSYAEVMGSKPNVTSVKASTNTFIDDEIPF